MISSKLLSSLRSVSFLCLTGLSVVARGQQPLVGVLKPVIASGGSPIGSMPDTSKMRLNDKQRQQMEAAMAGARSAMDAQRQKMGASLPLTVQTHWVTMLQRNGIAAVALDAETPDAAAKGEAQSKGAKWLLSTSVTHSTTPVKVEMGRGMSTTGASITIGVHYSLADAAGHTLFPGRDTSHTSNPTAATEGGSGMMSGMPDGSAWVQTGNDIAQAVASALPAGTVRPHDPADLLPKPPLMAKSVRFDMLVNDQHADSGYKVFGKEIMPGKQDASKVIFEYANGSIVTQQNGQGILYTPGSADLLIVDDAGKRYFALTPKDLETMRGYAPQEMGADAGAMPKLVPTDAGEVTKRHYTLETKGNPMVGQMAGAKTTVEIEFAGPSPMWAEAMKTLHGVGGGIGAGLIRLTEDAMANGAVWQVLFDSPNPPAHIVIKTVYDDKRMQSMGNSSEVTVQQAAIAKAADFTIPADYTWMPSPMLWMIAMY